MVKDKGEGEGTKPSSEATGVSKIQDDPVRARETEAKDISPPRLDKKEVSLPLAKIRSRCRSHQILVQVASDFWCDKIWTFIRRRVSRM